MSNKDKKICRLCLKAMCNNDFHTIDDFAMQMFDDLLLKLELNKNKENVMCGDCATDLQKSFDFKLACISLKNKDLLSGKVSPTLNLAEACSIENRNNAFDDRKVCRFCAKLTEAESCTCLNETKENMLLVDMLQQHIPELELNISEELVSCEVCLESLQHLFSFTMACSYAEQKIKVHSRTEVTVDKNKIKLDGAKPLAPANHVDCSAANVYKIEEVFIKIEEGFAVKTETKDEKIETVNLDTSSGGKEMGDESKQSNNERGSTPVGARALSHKSSPKMILKCDYCTFEAKRKSNLQHHILMHKTTSEVTMFKCYTCAFETKYRSAIKRHMLKHKDRSQTKMYSCPICSREFKHNYNVKKHMLVHKDPSDMMMHKCEICTYEMRHKSDIKRHMLTHTDTSDTKYKNVNSHKNSTETMYKCSYCSFETKQKISLEQHTLVHKITSEVTVFKCDTCAFETIYKEVIRIHMLKHKDPTQRKMYSCPTCSREFKHNSSVNRHMLLHKDPSDITIYKCEQCPYETRFKGDVTRHMQTHIARQKRRRTGANAGGLSRNIST